MRKFLVMALVLAGMPAAFAMDRVYDTRSIAMGGAGVAGANTRNAAFMNPSMLTSKAEEDVFALEIPMVAVRLLDEKDLKNAANTLKNAANILSAAMQDFQTAKTNYGSAPSPATQAALQDSAVRAGGALGNFNAALNGVSGKALNGGVFAGGMLAIPGKRFSLALAVDKRAELGAQFNYAASDSAVIANLSNALVACGSNAAANLAQCNNAFSQLGAGGTVNGLTSKLDVRGVVATDIGISMATRVGERIDVGITPKLVKLKTFDVSSGAQQSNGVGINNGSSNETNASVFNLDVGASMMVSGDDTGGVRAGLVVKDMIPSSTKTVLGNDISIKPRITAGVGYLAKLATLSADLDLVPNEPMVPGFTSPSQFLRIGGEFDAWGWLQLRAGYRHDLKNNYKGLLSAGLGLSVFGLHLDVSGAKAGQSEYTLAVQTGLHF